MTSRLVLRRGFLVSGAFGIGIAAISLACGSSSDSGAAAADGGPTILADGATVVHAAPVPFEQLIPGLIDAICSNIEACCNDQGYAYAAGACARTLGAADGGVTGLNVPLTVPPDSGLVYDPQAAGDCLATVREREATCKTPFATEAAAVAQAASGASLLGLAACAQLYRGGQRRPGEPCSMPYECAPSVEGAIPSCDNDTLPDGGTTTGRCIEILPTVPEGARCTGSIQRVFDRGNQYTPCAGNGTFDAASGSIVGVGACDDATLTCKSVVAAADGQPCDDVLTTCGPSSFCTPAGVCAPSAPAGAACGGGLPECISGIRCEETARCVALLPLGAACTSGSSCLSGQCNTRKVCSSAFRGVANASLCGG